MCQMKALIEQNHQQARQILIQNPALTGALFQAQIMLGMVKPPQAAATISPSVSQISQQPIMPTQQSNIQAVASFPVDQNQGRKQQSIQTVTSKPQSQSIPPKVQPQLPPSQSLQSIQKPKGQLSPRSTPLFVPQSSEVPNRHNCCNTLLHHHPHFISPQCPCPQSPYNHSNLNLCRTQARAVNTYLCNRHYNHLNNHLYHHSQEHKFNPSPIRFILKWDQIWVFSIPVDNRCIIPNSCSIQERCLLLVSDLNFCKDSHHSLISPFPRHFIRFFISFRRVVASEGPSALYRGMAAPFASVALQNAIAFQTYDILSRAFDKNIAADDPPSYTGVALGGIGTGAIQSLLLSPIELIKIRLQLQLQTIKNTNGSSVQNGPINVAKSILQTKGWRGVYRGLTVTVLRDAPAHGVYFWTSSI